MARVVCAAAFLASAVAQGQPVSIQFEGGSYFVSGWAPPRTPPQKGWGSVFAVYAGAGDVPPLLGSYSVQGGRLAFHPSYPQSPGVRYRAVFHPAGGGAAIQRTFEGPPKETTPVARVLSVYPSASVLPSNQLRLYIYFSAPMSQGQADERVHLLDGVGKPLPGVFLPGEELWDRQFQRLTMTFDPGRIKRGLTSNQAMGPPIAEGKRYTLAIDREWQDARGVPMVEGFRKSFHGGPAQRNPPDPKQWRLTPPAAGSRNAVALDFPTPMNYVLLQRMIQVAGDVKVDGNIGIERGETRWAFAPTAPWRPGAYHLMVDTGLEDLAGNHIGQAFDIDVFERVTREIAAKTIDLPFTVR